MIFTLCGSMDFASEMLEVGGFLSSKGHSVIYPEMVEQYSSGALSKDRYPHLKKERGLMRAHFDKIAAADAILIVNIDKNGQKGRIGANTLIEMGIALEHRIQIFLLNDPTKFDYLAEELDAFDFICLHSDLNTLENHISYPESGSPRPE